MNPEIQKCILAARRALDAAGKSKGRNVRAGHGQDEVVDLLADLMHCCHAYDTDFDECLDIARDHVTAAKAGAT